MDIIFLAFAIVFLLVAGAMAATVIVDAAEDNVSRQTLIGFILTLVLILCASGLIFTVNTTAC